MKFIISQSLNMKNIHTTALPSVPRYLKEASFLAEELKKYSPWELQPLLNTNEKIAQDAFIHYQEFDSKLTGHPALFAFSGLVYKNIEPCTFTKEDLTYAQENMGIMSGFYGVLRPLDGILPYRLELMNKIKINGGSLYKFWGDKFYQDLYHDNNIVINLASEEYAKTLRKYLKPHNRFIDILFLTMHRGKLRTIVTDAKMARGQMSAYIIKNRIDDIELLKNFTGNDFRFEESLSGTSKLVFIK